MKQLPFRLTPFNRHADGASTARFQIEGHIRRGQQQLEIQYRIIDPYFNILWPQQMRPQQMRPQQKWPQQQAPFGDTPRADNLWQHTCFECFLAPWGKNDYWECNFASNANWNCYRFSAYRANQQTETAIRAVSSTFEENPDMSHTLTVSVPIIDAFAGKTLSVGISAVIEDMTQALHYYALAHCSNKPDFHQRNSFMLTLTA